MTFGKNDHLDNYHLLPSPSTSLSPSSQLPSSSTSSSININDVKITIGTSNNNKVIMNGLVSAPFYYEENQVKIQKFRILKGKLVIIQGTKQTIYNHTYMYILMKNNIINFN